MCYFHHKKDGDQKHSKHQAYLKDGVIIGCPPTLNAVFSLQPMQETIL
jgi:hypothetical protein